MSAPGPFLLSFCGWRLVAACVCSLAACGGRGEAQFANQVREATDRMIAAVESGAGLEFRAPPIVEIRSRRQVADYLQAKLDHDLPPEKLERIGLAYRLFGLIPNALDLRTLLLNLYSEQVVGYFDPDSNALYVVEGIESAQVSVVLAHELVHALQAQYVPLGSLLDPERPNDEVSAVQAVMEGQATLVSIQAMLPGQDIKTLPNFWDTFRGAVTAQYAQMPVFNNAPPIIRETLIFPYLAGATFVNWFGREYPDTVPFGRRLPRSTEQILHPERYRSGDVPVRLAYADTLDLVYQDGLGEFETRVLLTALAESEAAGAAGALGWDGDQYGVYRVDDANHALVWWTVWDDAASADRFAAVLQSKWRTRVPDGRRYDVERASIHGQSAVRLVDAPAGWVGWRDLPVAVAR